MRFKNVLVILCIVLCFVFSSCDFLNFLFEDSGSTDSFTTVTVESDPKLQTYLVKLNMSQKTLKANQTGYARFADVSDANQNNDTESFVRNLNRQINEGVKAEVAANAGRSASGDRAVVSGYSQLSYSKGSNAYFYSYTRTEKTLLGQEKNISESIQTVCKYSGTYCYVFADKQNSNLSSKGISLSDSDYEKLGKKFDECYEREIAINGDPFYEKYNSTYFVPCNDKIVILVSDLFGDASEDQDGGVVGYFYQGDMYNQTYLDKNKNAFGEINSNECEMFYIDALFLTKRPDTTYSTLLHEFNHMINYVLKTVNYMTKYPNATNFQTCAVWFTEMLSMTTEDMFQGVLGIEDVDSPKGRLPYFNLYYNYGFKLWDDDSIPNYIVYANTYAFGAFLVRNFGGIALLKQLCQNEYVNEKAINEALKVLYPSTTSEEQIDFDYAIRKFSLCLFNTGVPTAKQLLETGENQYYSFNRATDKNRSDGLTFTAIDIMNIVCNVQNKDGSISKQKIEPVFYQKDSAVDLGPTGFSVHYIGQVSSFELYANKNEELEYYLIKQ